MLGLPRSLQNQDMTNHLPAGYVSEPIYPLGRTNTDERRQKHRNRDRIHVSIAIES